MSSFKLANTIDLVYSNPSSMGIKEVRQELESMGICTKSFIEKSEFVNALIDARKERKVQGRSGSPTRTKKCDGEDATSHCCGKVVVNFMEELAGEAQRSDNNGIVTSQAKVLISGVGADEQMAGQ
jgi:hypothetical protein